jgi:hypothetical protein
MSIPRRVLLSLACVVVAIFLVFLMSLFGLVGTHAQRLYQLKANAEFLPAYLLFALPGWMIALPFVVLLKDAEGWRGWATLLIGTTIGPAFMLAWSLLETGGQFTWHWDSFSMPLVIALLTTVCYVASLKMAHRRLTVSRR